MPPALHPRSIHTSTLFGSTLVLSFLVVGLPHLIACPVPRTPQFAEGQMEIIDADGRRYRRRMVPKSSVIETSAGAEGIAPRGNLGAETEEMERQREVEELKKMGRECPVPKPPGIVGRMLGFKQEEVRVRPDVRIAGDDVRIGEKEVG